MKVLSAIGLALSGYGVFYSAYPLQNGDFLKFSVILSVSAAGFMLNMWVLTKDLSE